MSNDRHIASDEASRTQAEQRRELAERKREKAEGQRQLLETIRREREGLREAAEAARVIQEEQRAASDADRRNILEALRDSADSLEATSAQMKIVEDMRQALYKLVGQTKKDTQ